MESQQIQQITDLAIASGKISAIKHVMDTQGLRLLPAKQLVENVLAGLPANLPAYATSTNFRTSATHRTQQRPLWPYMVIGAFLLLSIASFTGAYLVSASHRQLVRDGERVRANVVGLQRAGARCLAPIFEYEVHGETLTHVSSVSSNPPSYRVGEGATLFVDKTDSNRLLVDDFSHRWILPIVLGILGAGLLLPVAVLWLLFLRVE